MLGNWVCLLLFIDFVTDTFTNKNFLHRLGLPICIVQISLLMAMEMTGLVSLTLPSTPRHGRCIVPTSGNNEKVLTYTLIVIT